MRKQKLITNRKFINKTVNFMGYKTYAWDLGSNKPLPKK